MLKLEPGGQPSHVQSTPPPNLLFRLCLPQIANIFNYSIVAVFPKEIGNDSIPMMIYFERLYIFVKTMWAF